ncbi:UDP-N-acetylmuramoyl-L-alanyl-D-glutamate--2,6-diaminopimelate ligase [Candidatus Omnitrophota bacterium]
MKLHHLLNGVKVASILGNKYMNIEGLSYDSKQLKTGGLFFVVKGAKHNGADFVDEALERGAACIVSEEDVITYKSVCKVKVENVRKACARMAANFYSYPSQSLNVIGITGTNGKTTTLYLIDAILRHIGASCGTIGTTGYSAGSRNIPALNTTPSSLMLQMLMSEMVKSNFSHCTMEVSSHALHQHRVEGIRFKSAIFTNLSKEHLDYHNDMDEYFKAKNILFETLSDDSYAIVNADDDYAKKIMDSTKGRVLTYGTGFHANVIGYDTNLSLNSSSFKVRSPYGQLQITTPLIGEYNMYNILAAITFALSQNIDIRSIEEAIQNFQGAPGRLQRIDCGQDFLVFVDYAHTDDALKNVLSTLRKIAKKKIIVVFGCGGDRDTSKRPRMGSVAAQLADYAIIANDNPRSEEPERIARDISKGFPKGFKNFHISLDRRDAIELALSTAEKSDIVLIAGKGHEKYQIFEDHTIDFDDCKVCEELLGKEDPLQEENVYVT